MKLTRRHALTGAAALALTNLAKAQAASDKAAGDLASGTKVFDVEALPLLKQPNGSGRKNILTASALATGEPISLHESWAPAGTTAPPAHTIQHSELIFVLEGTLTLEHDGKVETAKAGDVLYIAYATHHVVKNAGDATARYMVLSVGGDAK